MQTLAVCHTKIKLTEDIFVPHSFHIVSSNFPIASDGILGKDFLSQYECKIDFSNYTLQIKKYIDNIDLKLKPSTISIPGRSEKIIYLQVPVEDGEFLSKSNQISKGVYIANGILKSQNGVAAISILNTNEDNIEIENPEIEIDDIREYDIFQISSWENKIENRLKILTEEVNLDGLNSEEYASIVDLCRDYNDIFYLPGDILSTTKSTTHQIITPDNTKPIHLKPYRLPESAKTEINNQIEQMLKDDIVEPSKSPWNFPLLVVPKKSQDGTKKWRVVIDFRKLNEITAGDVFPIPNINEILDQLGRSQYFSTLDMEKGYHQVSLDPDHKEKTAFSSNLGHYQFKRMPFGLKNAPATFQRLMNSVLAGLQGIKCFVYLDDVVVYGSNLHDHNTKLKEIFQCFREFNLKLNPKKCSFLKQEISYLGHFITKDGIEPDPEKISAIQNFPVPQNQKSVKSFLGLVGYYRKFIPNFSKI